MENDTDQIDENDAQLLLYLAGELSPAERSQFQKRLDANVSLQQRLERLRETYVSMDRNLSKADQLDRIGGVSAAHRRASAAVVRWAALRQAKPNQQIRRSAVPAWAWPVAAAACLLIGLLAWQFWPHENLPALAVAPQPTEVVGPSTSQFEELSSNTDLADAEQELDAVAYLRTMTE